MTRGQTAIQRLALQSRPRAPICRTCLHQIRAASSAAAPVETAPIEPSLTDRVPPPLTAAQSHSTTYKVKASVLLSRPPLLTRDLTPFEKSYFIYQRRLNERLALPFTRYFYYQRGTPEDIEWKRKIKERQTPARDIGVYNAYGDEGWNDELLVGNTVSEPQDQLERLLRDAEVEVKERDVQGEGMVVKKKEEVERPMPRVTEADNAGDRKSLNRALQKTLYLVVRRGKGRWGFPSAELARQESLNTSAERIIVQTGGLNMNTWIVGNIPIGHQVYNYAQGIVNEAEGSVVRGEKIFFMKARILAGQANLKDNQFGLEDFQWLAREEIQKAFHPRDWNAVKNILPER